MCNPYKNAVMKYFTLIFLYPIFEPGMYLISRVDHISIQSSHISPALQSCLASACYIGQLLMDISVEIISLGNQFYLDESFILLDESFRETLKPDWVQILVLPLTRRVTLCN